jgi:hypothetical protein
MMNMPKTTAERLAILETKVTTIEQNAIEIRNDLQALHTAITSELKIMRDESSSQHESLSCKVDQVTKTYLRAQWVITGAVVVVAFILGNIDLVNKLIGLLQ